MSPSLALFCIVAVLYSAVGQAGGTGYIAAMGFLGFAPDVIKPTALALNVLVPAIGCFRFYRVGLLTWRTCYPFAVLGAPFSLLGGAVDLPAAIYQPVVGALLLLAALQMVHSAKAAAAADERAPQEPPLVLSLLAGGAIGFVSGVTGVGGGIFLAPLVLSFGWISTRRSAAVSAAFNLLNSATALAGVWATIPALPPQLPLWLVAVGVGGLAGSWLGVYRLRLYDPAANSRRIACRVRPANDLRVRFATIKLRRHPKFGMKDSRQEVTMKLSARNILKGKIVEVKKGQTTAHVRIDIGGGSIVTASITNEAVDELKLAAGQIGLSPSIKASDVMIAID